MNSKVYQSCQIKDHCTRVDIYAPSKPKEFSLKKITQGNKKQDTTEYSLQKCTTFMRKNRKSHQTSFRIPEYKEKKSHISW